MTEKREMSKLQKSSKISYASTMKSSRMMFSTLMRALSYFSSKNE